MYSLFCIWNQSTCILKGDGDLITIVSNSMGRMKKITNNRRSQIFSHLLLWGLIIFKWWLAFLFNRRLISNRTSRINRHLLKSWALLIVCCGWTGSLWVGDVEVLLSLTVTEWDLCGLLIFVVHFFYYFFLHYRKQLPWGMHVGSWNSPEGYAILFYSSQHNTDKYFSKYSVC